MVALSDTTKVSGNESQLGAFSALKHNILNRPALSVTVCVLVSGLPKSSRSSVTAAACFPCGISVFIGNICQRLKVFLHNRGLIYVVYEKKENILMYVMQIT